MNNETNERKTLIAGCKHTLECIADLPNAVEACKAQAMYWAETRIDFGEHQDVYDRALKALDRIIAASEPEEPEEPAAQAPVPLSHGYFTVVMDGGKSKTFRVKRQKKDADFAPGMLVLSYLCGPDNTGDYKGCGFIQPDGGVIFWRRYKKHAELHEQVKVLVGDVSSAAKGYALESSRCCRCGRLLTAETTLTDHPHIGPDCLAKHGGF